MYTGAPIPVGAAHASELAYVFRHLDQNPAIKSTDEEKRLSDIISRYWTNFAKTGNPNGEGLPLWPLFDENKATVMYLKETPHLIDVPNIDKLKAMDEYISWKRLEE
jgi:para-nitrobenzyl esterase